MGDCEKLGKISIIGQHLKSIAFTKFDNAQLSLAVKIRMTTCSKEKRTLFKTSPKLFYKLFHDHADPVQCKRGLRKTNA